MMSHDLNSKYSHIKGLKTKEDIKDKILNMKNIHYNHHSSYKDLKNDSPILFDMHKELGVPVFFIIVDKKWGDHHSVVKNLPLHYFGFNNLFDGNVERLYQEIAYCIGNVIQNKNEPPLAIDDKVKLEQAGFDKVTSFRKM